MNEEKNQELKEEETIKYNKEVIDKIAEEYHFNKRQLLDFCNGLDDEIDFIVEPAIVVSIDPLKIAVMHKIFDNCTIYSYPSFLVDMFNLEIGTKLVSKNNYSLKRTYGKNVLVQGAFNNKFNNVTPYILDFCIEDFKSLEISFSDYYYSMLKNKASFSLKFDNLCFDGINKRLER